MSGIFGVCSYNECVADLFFGTDYHSHLGTRRGGMAIFDGQHYNRAIHNIENSPFRTKFETYLSEMRGFVGIGCISNDHPQPIILNSRIGTFAVVSVGRINNKKQLIRELMDKNNAYFTEMSSGNINDTEVVASLICCKDNIPEGIKYAQSKIQGSMTMIVSADSGLYAARDKWGRTPLFIGKKADGENGFCASLESFAYINLGYQTHHELGAGEIVFITADKMTQISPPQNQMKMCSFLWMYYSFPASDYEGVNVEDMRYGCGASLARQDIAQGTAPNVDYVAGIPDSGTPHAIGYANESKIPFVRPLIKYTPTWTRSFTPKDQKVREQVAKMKLTPASSLIKDKKLLFVEDSIVRGTQMRGLMDRMMSYGAKELHARVGCPPVLFDCKYLNFTRPLTKNDTISRRSIMSLEGTSDLCDARIAPYIDENSKQYKDMTAKIQKDLNLSSLQYHSLDGMLSSVGIDKNKLCTYCWNGKE
ncbi:MAG: amidophosphoribosyltransferase [Defluviitaleaceae bacterium]|nr:amidophosphoribosyltransferase [Defluviitaleaceae bacterium]